MAIQITREEYQKKFGIDPFATAQPEEEQPVAQTPQPTKKPMMDRVASGLTTVFGGKYIGEAIGTQIAKLRVPKEQRQFISKGPTGRQLAGDVLQSAALFTPVGRIAKGISTGARALGVAKGAAAIGKIGAGATAGAAFDVASNLQEGRKATDLGVGTAIGAAIPAAGVAKNVALRFSGRQAPRIINSLIKPLAKDFSYGKNPGRAVAEEGIVANNFDDLITKITESRQKVGQQIGQLGQKLSQSPVLKVSSSLEPLNVAMKTAASQNNPTLLNRLANVKDAITNVLEPAVDDAGKIGIRKVGARKLENLTFSEVRDILGEIGDMTQFTGNHSDDKLVNSALKQVYGQIKEVSLKAARELDPQTAKQFEKLTEKYGDLSSAQIAAKYRDKIVERSNLIGLNPTTVGVGSALVGAIASGGAAIPAILAGVGGAALNKLAQTPAFKTRLAVMLAQKSPEEVGFLFKKIPALRRFFPKGGPVSPGDRLLQTKTGQKVEAGVAGYIKDPKLGMSIKDVTKKLTPDQRSAYAGLKNLSSADFKNRAGKVNLDNFGEVDDLISKIESGKATAQDFRAADELLNMHGKTQKAERTKLFKK